MAAYRFAMVVGTAFLPIILLVSFFETGCWLAGESKPLSIVAQNVQTDPVDSLFMRQYYDQGLYRYKYLRLQMVNPHILALGTSRVMQFRKEMFGPNGQTFYNGGGMIQHLRDLEEFVDSLSPDSEIRTVIVGVEFWWLLDSFSQRAEKNKFFASEIKKDDALDGIAHASLLQAFARGSLGLNSGQYPTGRDVLDAFIPFKYHGMHRIGWYARKRNAGFRPDGSFDYGQELPDNYIFQDAENVANRIKHLEWGNNRQRSLSMSQIERLIFVLRSLREQEINVVCFLPPFSSEALITLQTSSEYGRAWSQYLHEFPAILKRNGLLIIDASSPSKFGLDDRCMIDGFHAMETFHVALLVQIQKVASFEDSGLPPMEYLHELIEDQDGNVWFPNYHDLCNDDFMQNLPIRQSSQPN